MKDDTELREPVEDTVRDPDAQITAEDLDPLWMRLINMIIIAIMLSFASSLLGLMTIAQFIVMLVNRREPNPQLAEIGTTLGVWMAKAARYQTGASEVKPWPWTEFD